MISILRWNLKTAILFDPDSFASITNCRIVLLYFKKIIYKFIIYFSKSNSILVFDKIWKVVYMKSAKCRFIPICKSYYILLSKICETFLWSPSEQNMFSTFVTECWVTVILNSFYIHRNNIRIYSFNSPEWLKKRLLDLKNMHFNR